MEELEERLGDQMETVLEVIRDALPADGVPAERLTRAAEGIQEERLFLEDDDPSRDDHEEQVFDDGGEGAGVEGDLEAEDDQE